MTPWAPTRLTSCIFHPGPTEAYEPLRSTLCPARTPFRDLAAPESTRKPPVCRSGISRARSFDLEVTPWAPTRLTSCIFHSGHTGAYAPLRSTRSSACAPFRDLAAPQSTHKASSVWSSAGAHAGAATWRSGRGLWASWLPLPFHRRGQVASPTLGRGGYHGCATWPTKSRLRPQRKEASVRRRAG